MSSSLSLITLQGLGNSILALPVVLLLREKFQIALYLTGKAAVDFYSRLPLGIEVVELRGASDFLFRRLERTDIAAALYPNWKRELLTVTRIGARRKIVFQDPDYWFTRLAFAEKIKRTKVHDLENNFRLVEHLGVSASFPSVAGLFSPNRGGEKDKNAVIHPTASSDRKLYPVDFWTRLIDALRGAGYSITMVNDGSPREAEICRSILDSLRDSAAIDCKAGSPLLDLGARMVQSELFIGLDSALVHLAALCGCTTVALWSYADYRRIYPYGNDVRVFLPKELASGKLPYPPDKIAPLLARSKTIDPASILNPGKPADFEIAPGHVNPVRFYFY